MNQILYHGRINFKLQRQHEHVAQATSAKALPAWGCFDEAASASGEEVLEKRQPGAAAYQVTRSSSAKLIIAPLLRSMWPAASWDRVMTWPIVSVELTEPDVIVSVQSTP